MFRRGAAGREPEGSSVSACTIVPVVAGRAGGVDPLEHPVAAAIESAHEDSGGGAGDRDEPVPRDGRD